MAQAIRSITDEQLQSAMFFRIFSRLEWNIAVGYYFASVTFEDWIGKVIGLTKKYVIVRRYGKYADEVFIYNRAIFESEDRFLYVPHFVFYGARGKLDD